MWAALYLVVGLPISLLQPESGQASWYPPVAIGVALLYTCGLRWWPLVLGLDLAVSLAQYHGNTGYGAISAVVTVAEAVGTVVILRRFGFRGTFERAVDVVIMSAAAAVAALLGASLGTLALEAAGYELELPSETWQVWATGDLTGIVLCLPALLLVVAHPGRARQRLRVENRRGRLELIGVTVLAIAPTTIFFRAVDPNQVSVAAAGPLMLCMLPVFWVALRFGVVRTSVFIVVLDAIANLAFSGAGPHLALADHGVVPDALDIVQLQLPILAISIAALSVAAAVDAANASQARTEAVIDASPVPILAIDAQANVTLWSAAAEKTFGFSEAEVLGNPLPLIPDGEPDPLRAGLHGTDADDLETLVNYPRRDGSPLTTRVFTSALQDSTGAITGLMGVIEDVTERMKMQERQALLTTAIDQASEAIVVTDARPRIIYANPAAATSSGYTVEELLGQNPRIFQSGLHDIDFYQSLWATILSGRPWYGIIVNRRRNGELHEDDTTIAPVTGEDGRTVAYVSIKRDLTPQRKLEADLQREQDDREQVLKIIDKVRAGGSVEETAAALTSAITEIPEYDLALVLLTQQDGSLAPLTSPDQNLPGLTDTLVTPATGAGEMLAMADRSPWWVDWSRDSTLTLGWAHRFRQHGITASAVAPVRWEGETIGALMIGTRDPEGATWMGSRLGLLAELGSFTGMLVGSDASRQRELDDLRGQIRSVIHREAFHPVFQPYVDLNTREIAGYEALTRFDDGTRPDLRIRQAWTVGLGPDMEAALAMAALREATHLPDDLPVSVNFSPETIIGGGAEAAIGTAGNRPVVIEITEHRAVDSYEALRQALHRLGRVRVSVDDAGAGFASLRHILELEPDIVKLDIGLIRDIDQDLAKQSLAAGMCHYATGTGTTLVAEGVETEAEARTVRDLGVQLGQGYLFGRPAPITALQAAGAEAEAPNPPE